MTPTPFCISSYPCYITSHMVSRRRQMNVIVRHVLKLLHYQHKRCLNTVNLDNISLLWKVKQQHTDSMTSVLSNNTWIIVTKGVRFDVFLLVLLKVKETRKDQIWNFHTCSNGILMQDKKKKEMEGMWVWSLTVVTVKITVLWDVTRWQIGTDVSEKPLRPSSGQRNKHECKGQGKNVKGWQRTGLWLNQQVGRK